MNISNAEIILGIVLSAFTLANMLFLGFISYNQYRLSKRNTELDQKALIANTYDRKFSVFQGAQKLLSIILRDAKCTLNDVHEFTVHLQQSYFLYNEEIYDYLSEIRSSAITLAINSEQMADGGAPKEVIDEKHKILKLLSNELSKDAIFKKFKPYLEH